MNNILTRLLRLALTCPVGGGLPIAHLRALARVCSRVVESPWKMPRIGGYLSPRGCSVLMLAAVTALASVSVSRAASLYTWGHADVRPYYQDGQLNLRYQLDYGSIVDGSEVGSYETGPVSFSLESLVTNIPDIPIQMPDPLEVPGYEFIGADGGDPLWYIPEVQEYDRPWLGLSTEALNADDWMTRGESQRGAMKLDLVSVSGPTGAYFSLFQSGSGDSPLVQFATTDSIDDNDTYWTSGISVPAFLTETHAHANWFFTQPGLYDVALRFSGEHVTDGYKEVTGVIRFAVGVPEPGTLTLLTMGLGTFVLAAWRRRVKQGA